MAGRLSNVASRIMGGKEREANEGSEFDGKKKEQFQNVGSRSITGADTLCVNQWTFNVNKDNEWEQKFSLADPTSN